MPSFDSALLQAARRGIEDAIADQSAVLGSGMASDFADYKDRSGCIKGMRDALSIMEEIAQKLVGGERS